jgi:predicted ATP-dependent endonuclease of OLD family
LYLSRIFIQNYRSISQLDISFSPGKNVLVGKNNAGKSNIIKAIDLVLGEFTPDYKRSNNISLDDFYMVETKRSESFIIWCELTRELDESIDFTTLRENNSGYQISKCKYREKRRFEISDMSEDIQNAFKIPKEDGYIWVNTTDLISGDLENELNPMFRFAYSLFVDQKEGIIDRKELRFFYKEDDEHDWIMSFRGVFRNELLQSAIIPSFRDPQTQLKLNDWSWFGKLMKSVTTNSSCEEELNQALESVKEVSNKIFESVTDKVTNSSIKTTFPGTTLHFQFNTENKTDLFKSCVIYVDDGFKSQLSEKGSGIQSAVIVSLFTYYMREINTKSSALLCIEEPELYLHPHGRRVLNKRLDDFLDDDRNQVILSTHNVEFLNSPRDDRLILITKDSNGTKAKSVNSRDIRKLLLDNNQNEVFFADKVIVCEGYDKYVVEFIASELFPGALDEDNVSVIQVSGKDNLCEMTKMLRSLQIKSYLLADFDFLLRDNEDECRLYDAKQHKNVLSLTSHFFAQEHIFGSEGNKMYGTIDKWRNSLKKLCQLNFYTAKTVEDIQDNLLKEEVRTLLPELRRHGLCILTGQLENLFIDEQQLNNEKLTLKDIYRIKSRIDDGSLPSEIFYVEEIRDLLCHVFNLPFLNQESLYDEYGNDDYSEFQQDLEEETPINDEDEDYGDIPF